jgi:putative phage-type endonuclease
MNVPKQNTSEWLEFRKDKLGASDAPIIMGVSPWKTPYGLWLEKLDLTHEQVKNSAMKRGNDLESTARMMFMLDTGIEVHPKVVLHPTIKFMMASFDGMDSSNTNAVEIKCPGAVDHAKALDGMIPDKYFPQLQHQIEVCQLEMVYYYSFDGEKGVVLKVYRDDKYIKKMVKQEQEFYDNIENVVPPALMERDFVENSSHAFLQVSSEWKLVNEKLKELERQEKDMRSMLISMCHDKSTKGGGLKIFPCVRKGNIDYSQIPELQSVNLDNYRKESTKYWRIGTD